MRLKRISLLFASTLLAVGLILAAGWMIGSSKAAPAVMAGSGIELAMPKLLAVYGPAAPDRATAATPVCDASMVAYWKLEESYSGSGQGIFVDSINGNDLTNCTGASCPAITPGKIGNGQQFVRSEADGIKTNAAISGLNWTTDSNFSIEAWMAPDVCNDRSEVGIGSNGGTGNPSWWLGCRAGGGGSGYFELNHNETVGVGVDGAPINTDSWHHLVAVRNGSGKTTTLYVDNGTPTIIPDSTIIGDFTGTLNTNAFVSAGWYEGGTITDTFRLNGKLDEVAIYNKALSSAEVMKHYNAGTGRSYCNTPPAITPVAAQTSSEGQTISLQIAASDADNDTMTYSATGLPAGLTINTTTGLISGPIDYTDSTGAPNVHNVQVTVTDDSIPVASSNVSFTWTVSNVNRAPVVITPAKQTSAEGGSPSLPIQATDPDNTPPTSGLTFTDVDSGTGLPTLPPGLTINGTSGLIGGTLGHDAFLGSPYTVKIKVSDGAASTSISFLWEVTNTNRSPSLTQPASQSFAEGDVVSIQLSATDPDSDTLTFSDVDPGTGQHTLPLWLALDTTTGLITGNVPFGVAGDYTVKAVVSDNGNPSLSDSKNFTLTITDGRKYLYIPFILRPFSPGS